MIVNTIFNKINITITLLIIMRKACKVSAIKVMIKNNGCKTVMQNPFDSVSAFAAILFLLLILARFYPYAMSVSS